MDDLTEAIEGAARRLNAAFKPLHEAAIAAAPIFAERLRGEVARQIRAIGAGRAGNGPVSHGDGRTPRGESDRTSDGDSGPQEAVG